MFVHNNSLDNNKYERRCCEQAARNDTFQYNGFLCASQVSTVLVCVSVREIEGARGCQGATTW